MVLKSTNMKLVLVFALLGCLFAAVRAAENGGGECSTISDCNNMGNCADGVCVCSTGRTCKHCEEACSDNALWSSGACENTCPNDADPETSSGGGGSSRSNGEIAAIAVALVVVFLALMVFLRFMMSSGESEKPEQPQAMPRSLVQMTEQPAAVAIPMSVGAPQSMTPSMPPSVYSQSVAPSGYYSQTPTHDPSVYTPSYTETNYSQSPYTQSQYSQSQYTQSMYSSAPQQPYAQPYPQDYSIPRH